MDWYTDIMRLTESLVLGGEDEAGPRLRRAKPVGLKVVTIPVGED